MNDPKPITDADVLSVARRHGTDVAAVWSGRTRFAVVALRRRTDGYSRGRGHPTAAEMEAAKPSKSCPCRRCQDWRDDEARQAQLRSERGQRTRDALRIALAKELEGLVGTDQEWRLHSNCIGVHPDVMFPTRGQDVRAAKAVCAGCTVTEACLDYALTHGEHHGIWGGKSERERRKLRAGRRQAPRHGTRSRYQTGCRCDDCRAANTAYSRDRAS